MLNNFFYFLAYTSLRDSVLARRAESRNGNGIGKGKGKSRALSAPEELAIGSVAGMISKFVTAPLSNVTVRQQTAAVAARSEVKEGKENGTGTGVGVEADGKGPAGENADEEEVEKYGRVPGLMETARSIVAEKGMTGLWSGFKLSCILVRCLLPTRIVMFRYASLILFRAGVLSLFLNNIPTHQ